MDAAKQAGFEKDVYIYPAPSYDNPEKQALDTVNSVGNRTVGRYWIVVENFQWQDVDYNRDFLKFMIAEARQANRNIH